jgi:hypothetical protein
MGSDREFRCAHCGRALRRTGVGGWVHTTSRDEICISVDGTHNVAFPRRPVTKSLLDLKPGERGGAVRTGRIRYR